MFFSHFDISRLFCKLLQLTGSINGLSENDKQCGDCFDHLTPEAEGAMLLRHSRCPQTEIRTTNQVALIFKTITARAASHKSLPSQNFIERSSICLAHSLDRVTRAKVGKQDWSNERLRRLSYDFYIRLIKLPRNWLATRGKERQFHEWSERTSSAEIK